jgi:hypothetical protein
MPQTTSAIDLETITRELADSVRTRAPQKYDRGRDRMCDAVKRSLDCTGTRARHIVASLVTRGYVRFGPHPTFTTPDVGRWTYHPQAEAQG